MLTGVEPKGPASEAGLHKHDLVYALDKIPVTGVDDLIRLLSGDRIGKPIVLDVIRLGQRTALPPPAARAAAGARRPRQAPEGRSALRLEPLGEALPVRHVVGGGDAVPPDLVRRQRPRHLARHAEHQRPGRNFPALRDQRSGADQAIASPTFAPLRTIAPMPTSTLSPSVQPWRIARWPIVQPAPDA